MRNGIDGIMTRNPANESESRVIRKQRRDCGPNNGMRA